MAREFIILHHRQSVTGGRWDLVENAVLTRAVSANAPHGEGSICGALRDLAEQGWTPAMELFSSLSQSGETHILLSRG
jgi:hypothetical protein